MISPIANMMFFSARRYDGSRPTNGGRPASTEENRRQVVLDRSDQIALRRSTSPTKLYSVALTVLPWLTMATRGLMPKIFAFNSARRLMAVRPAHRGCAKRRAEQAARGGCRFDQVQIAADTGHDGSASSESSSVLRLIQSSAGPFWKAFSWLAFMENDHVVAHADQGRLIIWDRHFTSGDINHAWWRGRSRVDPMRQACRLPACVPRLGLHREQANRPRYDKPRVGSTRDYRGLRIAMTLTQPLSRR